MGTFPCPSHVVHSVSCSSHKVLLRVDFGNEAILIVPSCTITSISFDAHSLCSLEECLLLEGCQSVPHHWGVFKGHFFSDAIQHQRDHTSEIKYFSVGISNLNTTTVL